jgi:hypothetical protein
MRLFYPNEIGCIYICNTSAPIRNLTNPQIVKITCSYFLGISRNLSWATRNIFTERIRCSTNIL